MQTSYNNPTPQYAGFFVRFAAFLIDIICIGSVLLLLRWSVVASFQAINLDIRQVKVLFEYSLLDVLLYFVQTLYFVVCTHLTGSTLGKKLLNLRVVHATHENLPLFSIIYRETIGRFLSGLFWSMGYIAVGIDKEKRGVHDFLGDTRVVYAMCPVAAVPPLEPTSLVQPVAEEQVASFVEPIPPASTDTESEDTDET